MSERVVSKAEAARVAMLSQFLAIALLATTVAIVVALPMLMGGRSENLPNLEDKLREVVNTAANAATETPEDEDDAPAFTPDLAGAAARFALSGGVAPPEPEPEPEPSGPTEEERKAQEDAAKADATEQEPVGAPVEYLGMIDGGQARVALLKLGGTQRFVTAGSSATFVAPADEEAQRPEEETMTIELLSVEPDAVIIRDNTGEREIEKAARTGPAVTLASEANPQAARARATTPATRGPITRQSDPVADAALLEELAEKRKEIIANRPARESFQKPDGTIDNDAYRTALRNWSEELRELSRNFPTGQKNTNNGRFTPERNPGSRDPNPPQRKGDETPALLTADTD